MKEKGRILWIVGAVAVTAAVIGLLLFVHLKQETPPNTPPTSTEGEKGLPDRGEQLRGAQEENEDVIAWLLLPGAEIDDPVVQAADNEYYLRRTWKKEADVWGCYFLDYECHAEAVQELDRVTIIYGHSTGDSPEADRFSRLKRYRDEVFCTENPRLALQLGDGAVQYEVFAAGEVPVSLNYLDPDPGDEAYKELLAALRSASDQPFEAVEVSTEDSVLILSTCTSREEIRYVVAARQLPAES